MGITLSEYDEKVLKISRAINESAASGVVNVIRPTKPTRTMAKEIGIFNINNAIITKIPIKPMVAGLIFYSSYERVFIKVNNKDIKTGIQAMAIA